MNFALKFIVDCYLQRIQIIGFRFSAHEMYFESIVSINFHCIESRVNSEHINLLIRVSMSSFFAMLICIKISELIYFLYFLHIFFLMFFVTFNLYFFSIQFFVSYLFLFVRLRDRTLMLLFKIYFDQFIFQIFIFFTLNHLQLIYYISLSKIFLNQIFVSLIPL